MGIFRSSVQGLIWIWLTPFQRDWFSKITIWVLDKTQTFSAEVNGHQLNALLLWREFAYKHGYNINQNTPIFALCITSKYKRPCYWFWNQALSFYSVKLSYKALYETSQMFCFEYTVFSNKTFEKSHEKILCMKVQISRKLRLQFLTSKEIVERRQGELIKFLFLPKMGLLGSQACNEKKLWLWITYELL